MTKNYPLVILLMISAVFIVSVNMSFLTKFVAIIDQRGIPVEDRPPTREVTETTSTTGIEETVASVQLDEPVENSEEIPVDEKVAEAIMDVQPKPGASAQETVESHRVAGLNCDKYGGPSEEIAAKMIYWSDIPQDALFVSPYADYGKTPKYLTFEPDEGGWNNIRMSMETATVLAQAMGRILVLPPEQGIYLLGNDNREEKNRFTFKDFFHFDSIANEHKAVEVISMEEFMEREGMTGGLLNKFTGQSEFPPKNKTMWDGNGRTGRKYWKWLRNVTAAPIWSFDDCVVGIPAKPGLEGVTSIEAIRATIPRNGGSHWNDNYADNATDVDGAPEARLREMLGPRRQMCVYDDSFQNQKVMHFMGDNASGARLLVHFYAFLFFENYHQDLWTKRFVRDHLRYIDEIQCAAARIVDAVEQRAIEHGNQDGTYDSFHIRRGDFQYKDTRISAEEIFRNTKDLLVPNSTIFIATDERDASFFDPLREHYNLLFLHDFTHLIEGLNKNYMGMLDQRIASRGRTFVGVYYSTFTGYINRMRGYHSQKDRLPGWEKGQINSYFYVPMRNRHEMKVYTSIKNPMWGREFPVSWRDIDHDLLPDVVVSNA